MSPLSAHFLRPGHVLERPPLGVTPEELDETADDHQDGRDGVPEDDPSTVGAVADEGREEPGATTPPTSIETAKKEIACARISTGRSRRSQVRRRSCGRGEEEDDAVLAVYRPLLEPLGLTRT